jgi:hypothetical protein
MIMTWIRMHDKVHTFAGVFLPNKRSEWRMENVWCIFHYDTS